MKHSLFFISLLILVSSCKTNSKKETEQINPEKIQYQIEKYSSKYHLFNQTEKPHCYVYLTVPRITAGLEKKQLEFIRSSLYEAFFAKNNGGILLQDRFKIEAEELIKDYKDLENDFSESDESISASFNWSFEHSAEFFEIGTDYLTFRVTKYQHTGGAHPNMTTQYFTLDLKKRKKLTKDLTFKAENNTTLETKILERIKQQFDTEEEFEMNIWKEQIKVTDNFYLKDSNLVFYYNPYEIGPHSLGPVEVSFSTNELNEHLKRKL